MEDHEVACKCGHTPEKNRDQFEIYHMKMGSIFGQELPKKAVLRCVICKDISIVSRV
jgi:hypothetical protein